MIKTLLIVLAAAAVISMACFTVLGLMGGFPPAGFAGNGWGQNWGGRSWNAGGPQVTRNLPYAGGYRLEVNYPAEITVTQGAQPRFTVTGPQGLVDQMSVQNGVIDGPRGPNWNWNWGPGRPNQEPLRIDIVTPDTREFHLSGTQKLTLRGYDQDSLLLDISGAAEVDGQGRTGRLESHISGAGHLELGQLTAQDAVVTISGAGEADLDARRSSDVSLSGAGHIQLKCRPESTQSQKSGFGDVEYGPSCSELTPPAPSSSPPAAPDTPAAKSKV